MSKLFVQDERTERLNGWLSFVFLMITQIILAAALVYQRYIKGLPTAYTVDLDVALIISAYGYWLLRLYLNAQNPVFTARQMAAAYVVFVAMIAIPTYFIVGPPDLSVWWRSVLPVLIGPAVILGVMWLAGYLGEKRIQKVMDTVEQGGDPADSGLLNGARRLSPRRRRVLIILSAAVGGATGGSVGGALGNPLVAAGVSAVSTIVIYLLILKIMLSKDEG